MVRMPETGFVRRTDRDGADRRGWPAHVEMPDFDDDGACGSSGRSVSGSGDSGGNVAEGQDSFDHERIGADGDLVAPAGHVELVRDRAAVVESDVIGFDDDLSRTGASRSEAGHPCLVLDVEQAHIQPNGSFEPAGEGIR